MKISICLLSLTPQLTENQHLGQARGVFNSETGSCQCSLVNMCDRTGWKEFFAFVKPEPWKKIRLDKKNQAYPKISRMFFPRIDQPFGQILIGWSKPQPQ
jgi:hypothetical protein